MSASKVHSDFSTSTEDSMLLVSVDGTQFHVSCNVLHRCAFFATMLSLPQSAAASSEPVHMTEDAFTLEFLLKLLSLQALPTFDSVGTAENILRAADKFEIAAAVSAVRLLVQAPPRALDPFRQFAMASRYDWKETMHTAALATLDLNMGQILQSAVSSGCDVTILTQILAMRNKRIEEIMQAIDSYHPSCPNHSTRKQDAAAWAALSWRIKATIRDQPSGAAITSQDFEKWPEVRKFRDVRCSSGTGCSKHDMFENAMKFLKGLVGTSANGN